MGARWILTLWDGTEVSRQVSDLAEAVKGYEWPDITNVRLIDQNGLDITYIAYNWDEAARHYELATNVAERCIWENASESLGRCYKRLKKSLVTKITEVTIL